jgi:hypothetical protein
MQDSQESDLVEGINNRLTTQVDTESFLDQNYPKRPRESSLTRASNCCQNLWKKLKRLTLYYVDNGIFMNGYTKYVSKSSQIATVILGLIVIIVFTIKMYTFN